MTTIQREIRTFKSLQIFKIVRSPAAFFLFSTSVRHCQLSGPGLDARVKIVEIRLRLPIYRE